MAGSLDMNGDSAPNGRAVHANGLGADKESTNKMKSDGGKFTPIAICGMACRLPSGIHSPQDLWEFLLAQGDARTRVPESRYNISAYHSPIRKPGTTMTEFGYFLDESVDLGAIDSSFFSMPRSELERLDPQQRLLLEVSREALDDAGEINWKGENIGVYVGNYGQDWYDLFLSESQRYGMYQITGTTEFMLSNRVSYEMDLRGPSVTIRTGCSAALIGLNEACMAIAKGDCKAAIVGGSNLILAPAMSATMSEQGVLNGNGSCKTFSANADGYARGEAVVAVFVKSLSDALRDGNPIRAVVSGIAVNHDGKTPGITVPSASAQEALMRRAYDIAGISDISKTGFVECHGTGTAVGDPIETEAVARVFGDSGIHIGSVKPNLGHSEGASGLTSLLKAVLALENRVIPPQIKSLPLNPKIPFERAGLIVPVELTAWPDTRHERVSLNSFGIGGSNAHVIIDSAASFNASRAVEPKTASDAPRLLVYSANAPDSLQGLIERYQAFLDKNPDKLADVAYTLANRRQQLPHRSFAVSTRDRPGVASPPSASGQAGQTRFVVMVFTGQGAQWPQMGRELLRSNPVFCATIKSLDEHLQTLGAAAPSWNIEEELLKPARTSRINEAEFSQPLCTALQLALVDTLASVGIEPSAVVGHSSGEIAAAYAAGALTAEEAITVAFHRGAITMMQTKLGAMTAVGLSWGEAEKYLVPGVGMACDNSPSSVTLSGDADKLEAVVTAIKESLPNVLTTTLKVEKAYHSHHMVEIGEDYHRAMTSSNVLGKIPSIPFFSSVTGGLLEDIKGDKLGPKYWQKNLESPVLFRAAVSSILKHPAASNPVFLEVGPHSALAGPVRQILTRESNTAPYVPSIVRRQNSTESYLCAVGKLYTLHVEINFKALMPQGSCLPDLPRYPWNHQRSYWFETRVMRAWRLREHPYHDLLGVKLPESTDLEPVWRNLFHLDNAPWIRDHKIKEDIVFPFAGYVAMAAEAVRQVTGVQEGVSLRRVAVSTALVVSEGKPTELVTTFRRHRLTDSLDSQWWEFTITSHNGHIWTKHCSGEVQAESKMALPEAEVPAHLPRRVNARKWYDATRRKGLSYGPHFMNLEQVTSSTASQRLATAKTHNRHGDEAIYHLHPVTVDSFFQLLNCSARYGLPHDYRQAVPTSVGSLTMLKCSSDSLTISASAELVGAGVIGEGSGIADSKTVLRISNAGMSILDDPDTHGEHELPITARCEWGQHVDFEDFRALVKPSHDHGLYAPALDELAQLGILLSQRSAACVESPVPQMQKYKAWLEQQTPPPSFENVDHDTLTDRLDSLVQSLAESPAAHAAAAISKVCTNVLSILSGKKGALEVLNTDDTLNKLRGYMREYDGSDFLRCLGHSKPNLRVLELGAGLDWATASILKDLTRADGQVLYSQYVFANISSGIINSAKERFRGVPNLELATLDISKDPADQGFQDRQFDLIIAAGVIHATPRLQESLINVRKLLSSNGRLLLQEPRSALKWTKYVLGTLPGWWSGVEDDRPDEPYVSQSRWEKELVAAGFQGLDGVVLDSEESFHLNAIMVAKPRRDRRRAKRVTLLCSDRASEPGPLAQELEARGYDISRCTIEEVPPRGQDVIALLDREKPFFECITSVRFDHFKSFADKLNGSGILWVTQLSQMHCKDPRYATVIGLARTIRSEMGIDFATCETDDFDSTAGSIADVFSRFHGREDDGVLGPDFEYAIHGGVTRVNRIFPFSLDDELTTSDPSDEALLQIARPGRLDSLQWRGQVVPPPQGDQVEIEAYSAGLNFKDVLVAMGTIELPQATFGYEAAGIVRRIGPDVKKLRVGDRAVMIGIKTFSTVVTATELLCEKLPDNLSFTEGASMPVVYATALYSLIDIGRLERGQSILIHSGCGGVSLAAIQVARVLGAEIYTTVSSDEKAEYLTETFNIPRNQIFNSRSTSFVDGIMRETHGKGANLVLNSLSGELLHATWRCVAEWGTMVEIGKRDLLGAGKLDMDVFLANRSYCCVDVDQMRAERPWIIDRLLRSMMDYFRQGHIQPIRLAKVYSAAAVLDAFRYMQHGSHIGKIVLELRDSLGSPQLGDVHTARKTPIKLDSSASYLLIGGLGGLGRSISVWMVQHGARNLTFLSRSAGSGQHDQDFVHEIESMGCTVQLVQGSVTNPDDVAQAVDGVLAPLKGVIQMSMVLRDQAFPRMSIDEWNSATQPKVQGTWNLHDITVSRGTDLDFFVLFSSLSGIVGQPGQANYASANTFLDSFVQFRTSKGLPCTGIDIGAVEDAGYLFEHEDLLRKMQGIGWRTVQEAELFEALGAAMLPRATQQQTERSASKFVDRDNFLLGICPTVPLNSPNSSARLRKDVRMAVYHNTRSASSESGASSQNLGSFLATATNNPSLFKSAETAALIASEIGRKLFGLLLKAGEEVNISLTLTELGMDSMVAIEMRAWWKQTFGFDISLLEMLGMGTLEALGKRAAEGLLAMNDA